jgi:hypothetical protein
MRRIVPLIFALLSAFPAAAQQPASPPHAWLFGAWIGGLFPPPVTLSAQECLAQPTVIFTRDSILRISITDLAYLQRLVETVRATNTGAEFRLVPALQTPQAGSFSVAPDAGSFGCRDADDLVVQRQGDNEIKFANCPAFPYPLTRCPSR